MVPTQLSNSGEVHFVYEVIHDIHGQVSSSLFRRRRSSKETLSFASLLHKRDSQYPALKKTTNKEMRTLLFPVFAFACYILTVAYASPDVTDVVQKVEVSVIYCCSENKADRMYTVSLLELREPFKNVLADFFR